MLFKRFFKFMVTVLTCGCYSESSTLIILVDNRSVICCSHISTRVVEISLLNGPFEMVYSTDM